jgi:hypothetical protein
MKLVTALRVTVTAAALLALPVLGATVASAAPATGGPASSVAVQPLDTPWGTGSGH